MTEKQMMYFASTRLYNYFAKLYFPRELASKNQNNPTIPVQKQAHIQLSLFMRSGPSMGSRMFPFFYACDIRENRFLCLGASLPSIEDEVRELFEDAECLLEAKPIKYDI
jgi:hypothetical protein